MTRKTTFYFSFLVLPARQRQAIIAVYDFCRAVDDSVDLEPDPARAAASLAGWRDEVSAVFDGRVPRTQEGRKLQPFVAAYRLPRSQFEALIDGVAMDVTPRRYRTFQELEVYCHGVASSVGLMCAAIFGRSERDVTEYARDLGVALQLTNILRDVAVDYRRGRCYLPLDDLDRFRCTEADIAAEVKRATPAAPPQNLTAVLAFEADRAKTFFSRAEQALPPDAARSFLAAEIMHEIYRDLLRRIEAAAFDVFPAVIRVPRPAQAAIAIQTWWRVRGQTASTNAARR